MRHDHSRLVLKELGERSEGLRITGLVSSDCRYLAAYLVL